MQRMIALTAAGCILIGTAAHSQQVISTGSWVLTNPQYPQFGMLGVYPTEDAYQTDWRRLVQRSAKYVAMTAQAAKVAEAANDRLEAQQQADIQRSLDGPPPPIPSEAQQQATNDLYYNVGHKAYLADQASDGAEIFNIVLLAAACIEH